MKAAPIRTGVAEAARCLALDELAAEVLEGLRAADIATVLLKGAGLAQRLYSHPDQRRYSDVDLLVAPSSFDQAQQVLAGLGLQDCLSGLRADEQHWRERLWRRPGTGSLAIDLHRSFAGVDDPGTFWEIISATTEPIQLSGVTARVPDAAGCALVVGLHAARPGRGRKALTDLVVALAVLPDAVWEQAGNRARLSGSTSAFARGLSRDPAGAALCARLGLRPGGTLADELAAHGVYGAVLNLAMLGDLSGWPAKVRHIAGRLAPSAAFMRYSQPRARRGPVDLALAYALRWRRIAGEAPQALLAVRAARRERGPARRKVAAHPVRLVRAVAALDPGGWLTCGWTVLTLRRVRRQLTTRSLEAIQLSAPPRPGRTGARSLARVLAYQRANCIQRALVRQRWLAGQGISRDLLIGVSAPTAGFHAHAWLEGDGHERVSSTGPGHGEGDVNGASSLHEIHRRPTPTGWLTAPRL